MSLKRIAILAGLAAVGYACFQAGKRAVQGASVWVVRIPASESDSPSVEQSERQDEEGTEIVLRQMVEQLWEYRIPGGVSMTADELSENWVAAGEVAPPTPGTPQYRFRWTTLPDGTEIRTIILRTPSTNALAVTATKNTKLGTEPTITVTLGNQFFEGMMAVVVLGQALRYTKAAREGGQVYVPPSAIVGHCTGFDEATDETKLRFKQAAEALLMKVEQEGAEEPCVILLEAIRDIDAAATVPGQTWTESLGASRYDPAMFSIAAMRNTDGSDSGMDFNIVVIPYMLAKPVTLFYPEDLNGSGDLLIGVERIVVNFGGLPVSIDNAILVLEGALRELNSAKPDDWALAPREWPTTKPSSEVKVSVTEPLHVTDYLSAVINKFFDLSLSSGVQYSPGETLEMYNHLEMMGKGHPKVYQELESVGYPPICYSRSDETDNVLTVLSPVVIAVLSPAVLPRPLYVGCELDARPPIVPSDQPIPAQYGNITVRYGDEPIYKLEASVQLLLEVIRNHWRLEPHVDASQEVIWVPAQ